MQFRQRHEWQPEKLVSLNELAANREADDPVVGVVRELRAEQLGHLPAADDDKLLRHRRTFVVSLKRSCDEAL